MKNLFERGHGLVGQEALGLHEESGHLALPAFVHFARSHTGACALEVFGLEITDQEAICAEEERIVVPAGFAEGADHFWPNRTVAFFVFGEKFPFHLKHETDSLHAFTRFLTDAIFSLSENIPKLP